MFSRETVYRPFILTAMEWPSCINPDLCQGSTVTATSVHGIYQTQNHNIHMVSGFYKKTSMVLQVAWINVTVMTT